jgi:phosphatidylglycerol---prolipoprotein diacylglyceryl transferase
MILASFDWSVAPEIFSIGPVTIRWYGLLWALSFMVGYFIMSKIFKAEGRTEKDLDALTVYMVIGTVLGARFGHCLFYHPEYYLANPMKILAIWEGGLASHGAAIGILLTLWFYYRNRDNMNYLWVLDKVVIVVALAAFFIRVANFFNSEIIGIPADVPWAVVLTNLSGIDGELPRHPAQLYEAFTYLGIFFLLITMYIKKKTELKEGLLSGLFMVLIFSARFFIEFYKENQTILEEGAALNTGQELSIPIVIIGLLLIFRPKDKFGF